MELQDKISAAKAALLRRYKHISGEHVDEKVCFFSNQVLALAVNLDLVLA